MAFIAPAIGALGGGSILGGIGTIVSVAGTIAGGIAARNQANYQAAVAKNNSVIAKNNAALASDSAQETQIESDRQTAALVGQQEAIQSASGLSTQSASALRTRRSANILGRQDSINIRREGDYNVQNYLQQSENFKAEASAQKAGAAGSMLGAFLNVGSSLVSGATSVRSPNRITGSRPNLVRKATIGGMAR
jgi:hypothetical protein